MEDFDLGLRYEQFSLASKIESVAHEIHAA